MFTLEGKTALVTGATGGIGQSIAKALHAQGAEVVLSGRNEEKLQNFAKELGKGSYTLVGDLSDTESVTTLFDEAEKLAGKVDILVCNAGITKDNLLLRMKDDEWQQVIDTNLTATFKLNKAAFKRMMKRKWGRIINIASVVGVIGNPGQANYVASKAGMIGFSKSVAHETASRGITVNCIAPGFIQTPMTDVLTDAQKEKMISAIPKATFGSPEDIASAAVFLASNEAGYITGQTLHVNGGMVMI
jgi:3-oxoacyl-[acyl-carrier protein] reductase